ncbi:extracellular solute-binding protein [Palleronia pelagia]|uniref:Peptide/nickel transport system substrate-binding protein n=1 Tax=Palleronia pelagia TaxID=387096 RepID=A0A1H8BRV1_9RHOB|nr:extracellular solute-binding protein [Palleronia pelagia]SEM85299.1 peptide/nickel transport system substrate-binding protein [Palleronia pelagia]
METILFRTFAGAATAICLGLASPAAAEPSHGIAMYGEPALPEGFTALPYANPDAPLGGRLVQGEVGTFDSLNPHILKGETPWQLRFLAHESLMGRSYDEPFTLYGVLAESIETAPDRSWVEFTLRPEARFSDGSPVTVEDVLWSYETLGTEGHPRYRGTWAQVASAEQTGERSVRFTFSERNDELALIMGMRPILKKVQWEGKDFTDSGVDEIPISSAEYVVTDFEPGRYVTLRRDPDYWGNGVVPFMNGQGNLDEIRMEFYGDSTAMFEAFKGGALNIMREADAQKWETQYDFPRVQNGEVEKSVIPHERPSGIYGFVMNTRRAPFDDWRVREALITAFNYEFINQVLNDGRLPRVTSYFSNSVLGMEDGPASGRVLEYLEPYSDDLLPGAIEGYSQPEGDGSERNRANLARAMDLLAEAGWTIDRGTGALVNDAGETMSFEILLANGDLVAGTRQAINIYTAALERLGIEASVSLVDDAQFKSRTDAFDFDMTEYSRALSLSPGNEQRYYWGSDAADQEGSRNWMGVRSPAIDGLIDAMLSAPSQEDYVAAVRALDRVLTSGRYVIPLWFRPDSLIAHDADLHYPESLPAYGDYLGFLPDVWWYDED